MKYNALQMQTYAAYVNLLVNILTVYGQYFYNKVFTTNKFKKL